METSTPTGQRMGIFAYVVVLTAALLALALPAAMRAQDASPADQLADVPEGPDTSVQYVGVVEGTEIYVAVVDRGGGVFNVYLCDGNEIAVWLEGTGDAAGFEATAPEGATARGTIADGTASGTVTLTGEQSLPYSAARAELAAGLFERVAVEDGEPVQVRTIVLADGTARGKKKKFDCAESEKKFERAMDRFRAADTEIDRATFGNIAHDEFLRAQRAGCAYASSPTS
jgi:hypothetical protein